MPPALDHQRVNNRRPSVPESVYRCCFALGFEARNLVFVVVILGGKKQPRLLLIEDIASSMQVGMHMCSMMENVAESERVLGWLKWFGIRL
jgi:hypothetical protein